MNPYWVALLGSIQNPPEGATVGRQSIFNKMQLCPAIQGYSTHEGFIPALGESLSFGDGEHYLINQHLRGNDPRDVMESFDEWMEDKLCNDYQWSLAQIPNYGELRKELFDSYRLWIFQVYLPHLQNLSSFYTETTLYMPLTTDAPLWLEGTPDLGTLGLGLWDWKTAKTDRQWSQPKADLAIQASLYLALHNYVTGEEQGVFTFAVYNRRAAEWTTFTTMRSLQEQRAALATALEYTKQMRAGAYPATPVVSEFAKRKRGWYCSARWCGAWNVCEHKFLNDNVDETEVAERKWQ